MSDRQKIHFERTGSIRTDGKTAKAGIDDTYVLLTVHSLDMAGLNSYETALLLDMSSLEIRAIKGYLGDNDHCREA